MKTNERDVYRTVFEGIEKKGRSFIYIYIKPR